MATQSVALSIPQVKFFNGNWSGWYSLGNGQDGYAGGTVSPNVFSTALQFKIPATTGISSGRTLQFKLWFIKGYYSSTTLTYAITQTAPVSGQRTPAGTIIKSGSFALTGLTAGYQQKTLTISGLNLPLGGGTYYLYLYNGYWCSFGNQSSYKASGTLQYTPYTATTNWSISTTSLNLGSALTISIPAAGSGNESNKHTFTYSTSAGHSGTIASGVGFSTSRSWTPAVSMAAAIPSGTSMSCTITCRTYASDGSTLVGSNTKSLTLTVPSSVVPTFTLGSLIANDGGRNNLFVAGISTLTAPLTNISGAQGSTVLSYSVTIGPTSGGADWSSSGSVSGSSLSITTPTLNFALSSGSVTKRLTVTIRDSRGRSASSSRDFTYYAYAAPVITSFTAIRVGSSSSTTEDVSGNYLMIYLKTNSVTSLGGANARVSSLTYSPAVSGTDSNPSAAWGSSGYRAWFDVSSIPSSITVTYSYKDDYGSTQATRTVVSASVPIDIGFNGTGIGIGKNVESNNLIDLGLNVRARRDLQVDGSITWPSKHQITYQDIPNGANLNTYLHPGFYRSWTSANTGIINKPADCDYAFELIVTGISDTSYCTQRVKAHASNTEWIRTQTSWQEPYNTWTNWTKIVKSDDLSGSLANYAQLASPNNLVHSSNECTFIPSGFSGGLWFNYRTIGGANGSLSQYNFGRGNGGGLANINVNSIVVSDKATTLSNLGAAPIGNLKRVDLWQGTCNKGGSVTVTNAYRYSVLWLVVTPGSGESEIIACEYNNRAAVRQVCSNNSWIGITSSISGNNKTFTVSGGSDGCKLTKIVGVVQFQ